jgi:PAS domain S-box-containing protein
MKPRPAVLVVDDEQKMCFSVKTLLENRGLEVEVATSGKTAMENIGRKEFDLFLLDIFIPDIDGFGLMERILSQKPEAPVVLMTGDASVDSAVHALKRGAYDYLRKPFEVEDLEKTIHNALRQRKLLEKNRIMEKRLRVSEKRFRFMIQNSPDMIYTLDHQGHFTFVNEAATQLFGYDSADLIGKHYQSVLHKEDISRSRWRFNERRTGSRATAGLELRLKPGPRIEKTTGKNPEYAVVELNATGMYRRKTPRGPRIQVGTYGVARDTTYRKALETQLIQAKKMEAIGNLAGGLAHDFNNLLMGVQGVVSLMRLKMEPDNPFLKQVRTIEQYVQDGAGLTRQLLTLAKGGALEIKPTDVNELIRKQNRMFGRTRKEITLVEDLVPKVLPVLADSSQIEQVLLNLYVNAGHAMPEGGRIAIKTENIYLSDEHVLIGSTNLRPGRHVKITVSDTGIGMDEQTLGRIFDPFFTTKQFGKGSGLGLYVAYGIIKNHGGFIQVVSKKRVGTTFTIYLPATERKAARTQKPSPQKILGRETILLVDDEEKLLKACRDGMKLLGYTVFTANSGDKAVGIFSEKAEAIDVVVLDMIMPGLSGKETYRRLKQVDPRVRVLLASGYAMEGQAEEILKEGCTGFIQKPFKIEQLSLTIQEIMETSCQIAGHRS